ncbi:importin alpha [Anaeramoeba ignava]|uniref:Importin subunit alpha n=1 Tax=Anaeramoeba ignava TaxID=1746090 RepID=A0A9Q0LB08_ANAIG|nr:importin alpha [Anaeramoeba ignava]
MSNSLRQRLERRKNNFKGRINFQFNKEKREIQTVILSKSKKEEQLFKRRNPNLRSAQELLSEENQKYFEQIRLKIQNLPQIYKLLLDPQTQDHTLSEVREICSLFPNPPIREIIDNGFIPLFIEFLQSPKVLIQYEAITSLSHLTSGSLELTSEIINMGIAPKILDLLIQTKDPDIIDQCITSFANIISQSIDFRDQVIDTDFIQILSEITQKFSKRESTIKNFVWISIFITRNPLPNFEKIKLLFDPLFAQTSSKNSEISIYLLECLENISKGNDEFKQVFFEIKELLEYLIINLENQDPKFQTPSLKTIGNLLNWKDEMTEKLINYNIISILFKTFASPISDLKRYSCWALSNICASNIKIQENAIKTGIIQILSQALLKEKFEIQKQAIFGISNLLEINNENLIQEMIKNQVVKGISKLLTINDIQTIQIGLFCWERILTQGLNVQNLIDIFEEEEAVSILEKLQNHENQDISNKANEIIENFFLK